MARFKRLASNSTDRVAQLLSEGLEAPEIAERLGMSRKAVSARLSDIRAALGWQAV